MYEAPQRSVGAVQRNSFGLSRSGDMTGFRAVKFVDCTY